MKKDLSRIVAGTVPAMLNMNYQVQKTHQERTREAPNVLGCCPNRRKNSSVRVGISDSLSIHNSKAI